MEDWFLNPDIPKKVDEFWNGEPRNLQPTMEQFKDKIWKWNQEEFGNIFWRKKRCEARLKGVQRLAASSKGSSLDKLERKLLAELENILLQEEIYWKQQARMLWLKDGEQNTKFSLMG